MYNLHIESHKQHISIHYHVYRLIDSGLRLVEMRHLMELDVCVGEVCVCVILFAPLVGCVCEDTVCTP